MKYVREIDFDAVNLSLHTDKMGKPVILMAYGPTANALGLVTPSGITQWPRCSGEGNFGTMWGPTEETKSKYTLDVTDAAFNDAPNVAMEAYMAMIEKLDDKVLAFVHKHQERILNRKNLKVDEVKMLQIRSVRPKVDKLTGAQTGRALNLTTQCYQWEGGGRKKVSVPVCDHTGMMTEADVVSGDLVAATMRVSTVYCQVGGDKFGISWAFDSVQVICQRMAMAQEPSFGAFDVDHAFGSAIVSEI
jgi:hypothetical protein